MEKLALRILAFGIVCFSGYSPEAQEISKLETNLAGVFQGKTLFIQNPYNRNTKEFCVAEVQINGERVDIDYNLSALKIDFAGFDSYIPVKIKVLHKDSVCKPIIINPEAVLFHTIFRFSSVTLSDSALVWFTKGERGVGAFEVERLQDGLWIDQEIQTASGRYEGHEYVHYPKLDEGSNKYRIRYNFPERSRNDRLYSQEIEYEYYPVPVTLKPKLAKTKIVLSRYARYKIYDAGQNMVLQGEGSEIDIRRLRRGEYVVYFNEKDVGVFTKE